MSEESRLSESLEFKPSDVILAVDSKESGEMTTPSIVFAPSEYSVSRVERFKEGDDYVTFGTRVSGFLSKESTDEIRASNSLGRIVNFRKGVQGVVAKNYQLS